MAVTQYIDDVYLKTYGKTERANFGMSHTKNLTSARNHGQYSGSKKSGKVGIDAAVVGASLSLAGLDKGSLDPTEAELFETWVTLGLIGVAPYVEEVFEQ